MRRDDPGSFFDPRIGIQDWKKFLLGINVLDHISQILVTIFGLKILKFLVSVADPDPGSGAFFDPWIQQCS
jgi:hypothetical protein